MDSAVQAKLGSAGAALGWLFEPTGKVNDVGRTYLLGQLLSAPAAAVMGSFCALTVVGVALFRTGAPVFGVFAVLELVLLVSRLVEWRLRERRLKADPDHLPVVDASVLISVLWCTLQGALAFTIMSGDDPVLSVLSATLVMALLGPICARNYAAPRLAFLLILLCDLPFVAGALASGEIWLAAVVPITPLFLFGAMQIITTFHNAMLARLAAEAKNRHLALHDSLTGILNRHGMDEALSGIRRDRNRQMALLCMDLDGFKQVNDTYGHGAGDVLLIEVTGRIQQELREDHLLARMGGDEFMVVIRGASPDQVESLVERLVVAISRRPYDVGNGSVARISASIGFACMPEDATTTVELRLRADKALYAAKGAGKGVGVRYGPLVERRTRQLRRKSDAAVAFSNRRATVPHS